MNLTLWTYSSVFKFAQLILLLFILLFAAGSQARGIKRRPRCIPHLCRKCDMYVHSRGKRSLPQTYMNGCNLCGSNVYSILYGRNSYFQLTSFWGGNWQPSRGPPVNYSKSSWGKQLAQSDHGLPIMLRAIFKTMPCDKRTQAHNGHYATCPRPYFELRAERNHQLLQDVDLPVTFEDQKRAIAYSKKRANDDMLKLEGESTSRDDPSNILLSDHFHEYSEEATTADVVSSIRIRKRSTISHYRRCVFRLRTSCCRQLKKSVIFIGYRVKY